MKVEERNQGDVLIIKALEERIDSKVALEFKARMAQPIDNGGLVIVLDLSKVDFIDSSGLGAIISTLKRLNNKSCDGRRVELLICGLQDAVKTMFSLTRMDRIFQIFDNDPNRSIPHELRSQKFHKQSRNPSHKLDDPAGQQHNRTNDRDWFGEQSDKEDPLSYAI